ncbi:crotonobetainyl-CoA:carnitine CoA-transferase CaiB-like acyl-CoA transferase [Sphingobium xenophagum]|uniref:Crotonobetainyl-CoA:carnitine CoA-transferase CaiB-like acyl-CoA transferase n=1 Tax=Sphingobium xenophagum TaxID=121428 RepID=A0ABU1X4H6_SPHXE|nr:CaiB/BaiF CoA-transferase family protein [Sphingobium xenophagum]MDR7156470.1 crotonobetainyl-CoA:carnitine CoA-transferase CaiB-like acyl-CoA transferase [Sphingobium xenophagum]
MIATATGPLSNLKVIDMTRVIAGPLCGQILGDLGADVIKIERPGEGDDSRRVAPPWFREPTVDAAGESTYYHSVNRNKRSLSVDFASEQGQALIRKLVVDADILIENYRTGTLARYQLGYEELKVINPRLVYCSVTGFGQSGPYSGRSGYDFLVQGMGGLMAVTGYPDGEPGAGPLRIGVPVADTFAGMNAAIGILAALESRHATGLGQHIDISLFESAAASLLNTASAWLNAGVNLGRTGNDHPSAAPYGVFEASDGYIIIATFNDREFDRLAKVLGHPEWLEDPRFSQNCERVNNRAALKAAVAAVVKQKTRTEWVKILNDATVSAGAINEMSDLEHDEHAVMREMFVTIGSVHGDVRSVASPYRLSQTPPNYRRPPPCVGEHTDEILDEMGYSHTERDALRAAGVV